MAIRGRELVEYADTAEVFERPHEQLTDDCISGRFG
jgi:ABC-type phosphate transport system ATPase subunit